MIRKFTSCVKQKVAELLGQGSWTLEHPRRQSNGAMWPSTPYSVRLSSFESVFCPLLSRSYLSHI